MAAANLARTVVFAAFIAVLGIFPGLYLAGGVPIVLQNMGPLLAGAVLGARRGGAAVLLFLALTALGLPLLSGGRGGLAAMLGPTGGFLIGWLFAALVTGWIVSRAGQRPGFGVLASATALGVLVDYVVGIGYWAAYIGDLPAAAVQSLAFVAGDAVKVVLVALIARGVHRAIPDLVGTTSSSVEAKT